MNMAWEVWWVFVLTCIVAAVTPGPAVLFVTSQSAWRGRQAGVKAALGIETANIVFWTLSAFGLVAAIAASHTAFLILKWGGVAYLAWLGVRAIAGSFASNGADVSDSPRGSKPYRDAVIVGLSNPKAMLFFMALLPQFLDTGRAQLQQIIILAATGMTIDLTCNTAYAVLAGGLRRAVTQEGVRRWLERFVGGVFLSLAAVAALYRRV
jgi:homoserine/homoserine lactone efflux protein